MNRGWVGGQWAAEREVSVGFTLRINGEPVVGPVEVDQPEPDKSAETFDVIKDKPDLTPQPEPVKAFLQADPTVVAASVAEQPDEWATLLKAYKALKALPTR